MKKKDTYVFPAILTYDEGYEIAVTFPDLPGCATSGKNEAAAFAMEKEALGGHLCCMEEIGEKIPAPTSLASIKPKKNERAILVEVYMPTLRMANSNKAVNRTVTIPAWLNAAVREHKINCSQVLQNALKQILLHA